jgi:RND family efflux transporter MFP subunit
MSDRWFGKILFGFIAFCLFVSCQSQKKEDSTVTRSSSTMPVAVVPVVRQKISEKLAYTGWLEAWQQVNITPEMAGKVAKIYVEEGQPVRKGQVLAELETESVTLQLKQAEAALAVAQANSANASKNKERMDRLLREKAVSEQQSEQVNLAYDAAKAQLEQAQAAVNLARHALDTSIMRAPFDGIIASKNAQVGDVINPMMGSFSATSGVLTLVDFSRIKIVVEVSESDIARIRKGQPVVVQAGDGGTKEVTGTVSIVNTTADPLAKKFRVEAVFNNPGLALRPGTFGSAVFEVSTHENALIIPQKAILENSYVFVAQGNRAVKRNVLLGLKNTDNIEVTDGLKEGELVIVEGNYGLTNGSEIAVKR